MNEKVDVVWHEVGEHGALLLASLSQVVEHLRQGGLAVLPTETGYMLAAVGTDREAVTAVFRAKGRPLDLPVHVAVASMGMVDMFSSFGESERRIVAHLCPGPVTAVGVANGSLVAGLVEWRGTVGLRVPACATTLHVVATLGVPLTATSLNLHGAPSGGDPEADLAALHLAPDEVVHVVRADVSTRFQPASTLVQVISADEVEVLREGPVGRAQVLAAMATPVTPALGVPRLC